MRRHAEYPRHRYPDNQTKGVAVAMGDSHRVKDVRSNHRERALGKVHDPRTAVHDHDAQREQGNKPAVRNTKNCKLPNESH